MKNNRLELGFEHAICYSGYREGQSPVEGVFPSYHEIHEDLNILKENWKLLRLYDCSWHAEFVLEVIRNESLDFKVMLGADMAAEESNPNCPWGADYDEITLISNRRENSIEVDRLIRLANDYPDIISSVSIGNEATVDWSDHLVPIEKLISNVHRLKAAVDQPVTFCENYVPWTSRLESLAGELDFISLHSYPVWEHQTIDSALDYTRQNYYSVANHYPDKPVVITEAGWTTCSNGRGIQAWNASQEFQAAYYCELLDWCKEENILAFVFEAFDEPWKGSPDPSEPEKHWGVFTVDRKPKLVMQEIYAHL
ncbi:MAG: glycosyl hydrolase [Gammaproteobacteria bacterium]|jgi:exo-beta-1,3-glucanase (GH17 family)